MKPLVKLFNTCFLLSICLVNSVTAQDENHEKEIFFKGETRFMQISIADADIKYELCRLWKSDPGKTPLLSCEHIATVAVKQMKRAIQCREDKPDYIESENRKRRFARKGRWVLGAGIATGVGLLIGPASAVGIALADFGLLATTINTGILATQSYISKEDLNDLKTSLINTEILNNSIFEKDTRFSDISSDQYVTLLKDRMDSNFVQDLGGYCKLHRAAEGDSGTYNKPFSWNSEKGKQLIPNMMRALGI